MLQKVRWIMREEPLERFCELIPWTVFKLSANLSTRLFRVFYRRHITAYLCFRVSPLVSFFSLAVAPLYHLVYQLTVASITAWTPIFSIVRPIDLLLCQLKLILLSEVWP